MNESNLNKSTVIVVLGMHRSGTSVLTRALSELGVYLGGNLMEGLPDNPKGFYEDVDVVSLNDEILRSVSSEWNSTIFHQVSDDLMREFKQRAINIIVSKFNGHALFAVKDPRITMLQYFWRSVFDELGICMRYILANRHPFSVAESLVKRNEMHRNVGLVLWLKHQVAGMNTILDQGGLVVNYEQFLENPGAVLANINIFLGSPLSDVEITRSEFISSFIDVDLCHHGFGDVKAFNSESGLEVVCSDLYQLIAGLRGVIQGDRIDNSERHDLKCKLDGFEIYINEKNEFLDVIDSLSSENSSLKIKLKESIRKFNRSQPYYKKIYWYMCKKMGA